MSYGSALFAELLFFVAGRIRAAEKRRHREIGNHPKPEISFFPFVGTQHTGRFTHRIRERIQVGGGLRHAGAGFGGHAVTPNGFAWGHGRGKSSDESRFQLARDRWHKLWSEFPLAIAQPGEIGFAAKESGKDGADDRADGGMAYGVDGVGDGRLNILGSIAAKLICPPGAGDAKDRITLT